ncbi:hypothetical protein ACV1DW_01710, partial [Aeromonas hydrophila]
VSMMAALKVMTYFKVSLSTHNWDRAIFIGDGDPSWGEGFLVCQPNGRGAWPPKWKNLSG